MITGKGSIWKFAFLFALVLVAVLDLIFATQSLFIEWLNGLLVAGSLLYLAYDKYKDWSEDDNS